MNKITAEIVEKLKTHRQSRRRTLGEIEGMQRIAIACVNSNALDDNGKDFVKEQLSIMSQPLEREVELLAKEIVELEECLEECP